MAGSQLKRLKATLREQGIIGPQQSKKQKKRNAQDAQARNDRRLRKSAALDNIREQFNPFQFQMNARGPKFQVTSSRTISGSEARGIKGRPEVALAQSEERRRQTLLVEMQRRNHVGGVVDRRFGEGLEMSEEEKAAQRFAIEKQRNYKKRSLFDLEDDGPDFNFGEPLSLRDDYVEDDPELQDDDNFPIHPQRLKRIRGGGDDDDADAEAGPERKKSKQEVYSEIITKSKLHKYERQVAAEDDREIRLKLDEELADIQDLLSSQKHDQSRAGEQDKSGADTDQDTLNKNYDLSVKQMVHSKKSQPSERTKTEAEIAEEQAQRLKDLEEDRERRMLGQQEVDGENEEEEREDQLVENAGRNRHPTDTELGEDEFGIGRGIRPTATELGFDSEDDFMIEDDLVAGSDLELELESEHSSAENHEDNEDDEDDEFIGEFLKDNQHKNRGSDTTVQERQIDPQGDDSEGIPFTFPCFQTSSDLREGTQDYPLDKLPLIVQRIRALYHPKVDNRNLLRNFSTALLDHVVYLANTPDQHKDTYIVLESLIRHVHSLAKMFPIEIAKTFRSHLQNIAKLRPLAFTTGDLILLTAISTTWPSSDWFHQVATPAALVSARFLGQAVPETLASHAIGAYVSILSIQNQQLSKRYMPEILLWSLRTLLALAPVECWDGLGPFPSHLVAKNLRIQNSHDIAIRKLNFRDCDSSNDANAGTIKVALLSTQVSIIEAAQDVWKGKAAYTETFQPISRALKHLSTKPCKAKLPAALSQHIERVCGILDRSLAVAHLSRRQLELHHHRPLAIRTYIPKFEDSFDPHKHYDPNRERSESAKLKAELKRERKGAMRELRKDANFMAREKLRMKKSQDEAYEKKYKRLVAEIQGEEGREANAYEREKVARKRARHKK